MVLLLFSVKKHRVPPPHSRCSISPTHSFRTRVRYLLVVCIASHRVSSLVPVRVKFSLVNKHRACRKCPRLDHRRKKRNDDKIMRAKDRERKAALEGDRHPYDTGGAYTRAAYVPNSVSMHAPSGPDTHSLGPLPGAGAHHPADWLNEHHSHG